MHSVRGSGFLGGQGAPKKKREGRTKTKKEKT